MCSHDLRRTSPPSFGSLISKGFSLIEAMVAASVLAVLAAVAAPDFSRALRDARIASVREEFIGALSLARGESIVRRAQILLARNPACSVALQDPSDWSCGWRVVVDLNANGQVDAGEPLLQSAIETAGIAVAGYANDAPGLGSVLAINRWGQLAPGSASLVFYAQVQGITDQSTSTVCLGMDGMRKLVKSSTVCAP